LSIVAVKFWFWIDKGYPYDSNGSALGDLHQLALAFDGFKSPKGGFYAAISDYDEQEREESGRCSAPRAELVIKVLAGCGILCIGGISLACWSLFNVNKDRRFLGATLEILGLGAFAVGWLSWWGGLIFGLPPG
jgi:hypothetical protein